MSQYLTTVDKALVDKHGWSLDPSSGKALHPSTGSPMENSTYEGWATTNPKFYDTGYSPSANAVASSGYTSEDPIFQAVANNNAIANSETTAASSNGIMAAGPNVDESSGNASVTADGNSNSGVMAPSEVVAPSVDLSGVTNAIGGVGSQVTGVSNQVGGIGTQVSGVGSQVTGVSDQVDAVASEIAGVNTAVTGVGTQVTGVSDQVTGIANQVSGVTDSVGTVLTNQDNIASGVSGLAEGQTANTASIEQAIQDKFNLTDAQIQQLSSDILSGQTTLAESLNKMSVSADTYYGGLAEGQATMQNSLGGVQSDVTDFRTTYDENTTQANKQQGQLMSSVAGGFDMAQQQRQAIASQSPTVAAASPASSSSMYSDTAKSVTQGVGPTNDDQVQSQNQYLTALNAIKTSANELAAQDPSNAMLPVLSQVATAFDTNGKLIAENTSADGGLFARLIDATGNLITSTFDSLGQRTNQTSINLNTLFAQYAQSGLMA
jgi:archaellum component FlaC